jgi:hypothetical protein
MDRIDMIIKIKKIRQERQPESLSLHLDNHVSPV